MHSNDFDNNMWHGQRNQSGTAVTRLASFEQKNTRNTKSQEQGSEHGASNRPTEVILEDTLFTLEGFNERFDQIEHKLESVASKIKEQTKNEGKRETNISKR